MSYVPNQLAKSIALTSLCPICLAEVNEPCVSDTGRVIEGHHSARLAYAKDPKRYAHLLETQRKH